MRTARALLARVPVDAPAPTATPAPAAGGDVLRFGDFEIDPTLFELRRRGERVRMEPQVFEVLCYLAQRRGALVTRSLPGPCAPRSRGPGSEWRHLGRELARLR